MKPQNTLKSPLPKPTAGGTTEIPVGYQGTPKPRATVTKQRWASPPVWAAFHVFNVSTFRK